MATKPTNKRSGSAVRHTAHTLRQDVLSRPDGAFLGSETDLVNRLRVSRPTFRQAAKLIEQEQLLIIKRGVGGGFFVRQPSTKAVAHVAAVYLLSRKATMEDAIRAARPLFADTARLAALRRDPAAAAQLSAYVVRQPESGANQVEIHNFLRSEREFLVLFASLSGNPVLELYCTVLVDFAGNYVGASVYSGHPERIAHYCGLRRGLIQAIIAGDEQVAQLMSHRRSDAIVGWMEEDMGAMTPLTKGSNAKRSKQYSPRLIGLTSPEHSTDRKSSGQAA